MAHRDSRSTGRREAQRQTPEPAAPRNPRVPYPPLGEPPTPQSSQYYTSSQNPPPYEGYGYNPQQQGSLHHTSAYGQPSSQVPSYGYATGYPTTLNQPSNPYASPYQTSVPQTAQPTSGNRAPTDQAADDKTRRELGDRMMGLLDRVHARGSPKGTNEDIARTAMNTFDEARLPGSPLPARGIKRDIRDMEKRYSPSRNEDRRSKRRREEAFGEHWTRWVDAMAGEIRRSSNSPPTTSGAASSLSETTRRDPQSGTRKPAKTAPIKEKPNIDRDRWQRAERDYAEELRQANAATQQARAAAPPKTAPIKEKPNIDRDRWERLERENMGESQQMDAAIRQARATAPRARNPPRHENVMDIAPVQTDDPRQVSTSSELFAGEQYSKQRKDGRPVQGRKKK